MNEQQNDIFISYSRMDADTVYPVVKSLEDAGFSLWIDKNGVESGDAFKTVIVKAIENCKVFIFFSSKDSNISPWTTKEIAVAIYEKKRVIPIRLDNTKYNSEIKFDLINLDYIEMFDLTQIEEGTRRLLRSLSNLKSEKPVTDAPDDRTKEPPSSQTIHKTKIRESAALPEKENHKKLSIHKNGRYENLKVWSSIILYFLVAFCIFYGICFGCGYFFTRYYSGIDEDMQVELLNHTQLSGPIATYQNNGIVATYDAEASQLRGIQVNEKEFSIEGTDFLRAASISSGFMLWANNMKFLKAKGKAGAAVLVGSFIGTLFGYSTGKYIADTNNRADYQKQMIEYLKDSDNWIICQRKYDERKMLENP